MSGILLVTGGSRGIGRDVSLLAGERGWDIVVNYSISRDKAEDVAGQIRSHGRRSMTVQADVSKIEDVERMFATIDSEFGRLDGLVNNAGVGRSQGQFEDCLSEHLRETFEVNVFGLFYCSQAAVRRMSTKYGGSGGSIVNVSSAAARTGGANAFIDYAASKGAVDTITTGLARELGPVGIRVNAVRPGVTATEMLEYVRETDASWLDDVVKTMPMGRIGEVREIAYPILWLLSDEASYVTGTIVDASGGRAMP